jgi:NAD(P)-dependent dehydrogenase (short-subunit alcohol dehydrogenase family)
MREPDFTIRCSHGFETPRQAGVGHWVDSWNRFHHRPRPARERAKVIVNGRTEQKVAEAVQRISSEVGSRAVGISADLGSAEGLARLVAEAGRVDVLVNNVGIFWPVPFLEISDEDWFRIVEVNVMSGLRLARELLPQMLKRNWGCIIFISSESALQIRPR